MSNDELIARAEAALEGVTEGPWEAALERGCHGVIAHVLPEDGANFVAMVGNDTATPEKEPSRFANARFIAEARNIVPALIAALKASEARVKQLEEALSTGIDLIKGEKTGLEWKRACRNFIKEARAAQKGGTQ